MSENVTQSDIANSSFTGAQVDAGAEALRQVEQGGRLIRQWSHLPNADKQRWRSKASAVLRAAETIATTPVHVKEGRDFFVADDSDQAGIPWRNFVTALQVWSFMRPSNDSTTVREAADEFGVTDQVIRDAIDDCYWMFLGGPDDDPTKQYIDHEGE